MKWRTAYIHEGIRYRRSGCNVKLVIFKHISSIDILFILKKLRSGECHSIQVNAARPNGLLVIIGSDNGFVQAGNKTLPETMLSNISVVEWRHSANQSNNVQPLAPLNTYNIKIVSV